MKKILITLLIILFSIPLFAQELSLSKNNRKQQIKNFFSTDTTEIKDTVYIIEYRYYENDYYLLNRPYFYGFYSFDYSYYNWYYNWHYYDYYYPRHNHYVHKRRLLRPNRQRTITTRVTKSVVRPDNIRYKKLDVRPVRNTNSRYNRPASTYKGKSNSYGRNTRQPKTYNRPTTNRPTSTYNRLPSNTRNYNAPTRSRSSNTTVRNNSSSRSGSSTRSTGNSRNSSGSRGRR